MIRCTDILVSVIALLALAPLLVVAVIILRVTGEGEVIFRQKRIGKNEATFQSPACLQCSHCLCHPGNGVAKSMNQYRSTVHVPPAQATASSSQEASALTIPPATRV